jgi:hypothetical protein
MTVLGVVTTCFFWFCLPLTLFNKVLRVVLYRSCQPTLNIHTGTVSTPIDGSSVIVVLCRAEHTTAGNLTPI